MDDATPNMLLTQYLREMRVRLDQVAGIARAAEACAEAGNIPKAIEIALDIEQPIYEVTTFLNAASLMNRLEGLVPLTNDTTPTSILAPWRAA